MTTGVFDLGIELPTVVGKPFFLVVPLERDKVKTSVHDTTSTYSYVIFPKLIPFLDITKSIR